MHSGRTYRGNSLCCQAVSVQGAGGRPCHYLRTCDEFVLEMKLINGTVVSVIAISLSCMPCMWTSFVFFLVVACFSELPIVFRTILQSGRCIISCMWFPVHQKPVILISEAFMKRIVSRNDCDRCPSHDVPHMKTVTRWLVITSQILKGYAKKCERTNHLPQITDIFFLSRNQKQTKI